MTAVDAAERSRPQLVTVDRLVPLGLMAAAFVGGYVLVGIGARFGEVGPVVVASIPLLPAAAVLVLDDPRWGVAAIVATLPIGVISVPVLPLQLVQLVVLGVAVLVGIRRLAAGSAPLPLTPPMHWVVAFCALLVIALPSAIDPQLAVREIGLFTVGLVTAAVVVAACRRTADVTIVLQLLLAVAAGVAATVPLHVSELRAAYGGAVVAGRATGIFVEPNQMGTFAATGALVGIGLAFGARTARARWLAAAAAAMCTIALLLSLSRGAWIGFALGVIVLAVKLADVRRAVVVAAVPLFVVAFAIGSFAPASPQAEIVGARLQSIAGEKNPYDSRPALWAEAIREIEADPLTGQGPGGFPVASTRATSKSRTVFGEHAHDMLLTWAAEDGIPAAMVALALAVTLHLRLRRAARRSDRRDRAVIAGVAAALAAVAGQGIVDYTLRNSVILTTLFILLGCAFAFDRMKAPAVR